MTVPKMKYIEEMKRVSTNYIKINIFNNFGLFFCILFTKIFKKYINLCTKTYECKYFNLTLM